MSGPHDLRHPRSRGRRLPVHVHDRLRLPVPRRGLALPVAPPAGRRPPGERMRRRLIAIALAASGAARAQPAPDPAAPDTAAPDASPRTAPAAPPTAPVAT